MINLILDCSYGMNVFVVKDGEVFSFEDKTQNKHSDEILKVIDGLLKNANIFTYVLLIVIAVLIAVALLVTRLIITRKKKKKALAKA